MSFNNGKTLRSLASKPPRTKKAPDGTTLKDYLGLTAKEEQRLNQLSPDEIDTISQVKNLQAREVLSRNEVSPGELLAIKKLDQVQQVTGYSMKEKGQYLVNFSISDYPKLAINIAQSLATAEPVEKFIVSNALATFSQKEKGKSRSIIDITAFVTV